MKFSVNVSDLTLGVSTVGKAISSRTTIPVLENIYIQADTEGKQIVMRGNDLELGIEYKVPIESSEIGEHSGVLLKSATLSDILAKLNSDNVEIDVNALYKANIKSSSVDFDILGINPSEYPEFPKIEGDISFQLDSKLLLELIKHTIFSVSYDETKQFLNGIKIESKGNRCDFISTDGFRLSLKYAELQQELPEFSCIVPYKTMNELSKVMVSMKAETVQISMSDRQISFHIGDCKIISRLINGRFPDYKQVLPKNTLFEYKLSRQLLLNAADRANIIASHSNSVAKFKFSENDVTISASNAKLGDYLETLAIDRQQGERDIIVSFNIKLLQEALKIIEQQDVVFEINSELSPCVIKPIGDLTYTHILMPIRMSDYSDTSDSNSAVNANNDSEVVASSV